MGPGGLEKLLTSAPPRLPGWQFNTSDLYGPFTGEEVLGE